MIWTRQFGITQGTEKSPPRCYKSIALATGSLTYTIDMVTCHLLLFDSFAEQYS